MIKPECPPWSKITWFSASCQLSPLPGSSSCSHTLLSSVISFFTSNLLFPRFPSSLCPPLSSYLCSPPKHPPHLQKKISLSFWINSYVSPSQTQTACYLPPAERIFFSFPFSLWFFSLSSSQSLAKQCPQKYLSGFPSLAQRISLKYLSLTAPQNFSQSSMGSPLQLFPFPSLQSLS